MKNPLIRVAVWLVVFAPFIRGAEPIDRQALVSRHNPTLRKADIDSPLTVGNGGFAFGADITGMQTFAEEYHRTGIPTETLSRWCWHTAANPNNFNLSDANKDFTKADGSIIQLPTAASTPAGDWLRKNPHNVPLGQIRLIYQKPGGGDLALEDIANPVQTLDMWKGLNHSKFEVEGTSVEVTTTCHPDLDLLAFHLASPLLSNGKLRVEIAFARGHDMAVKNTPGLDWTHPESHKSILSNPSPLRANIDRKIDDTHYQVVVTRDSGSFAETSPHHFLLAADKDKTTLDFSVAFSPTSLPENLPTFAATIAASAAHWEKFWRNSAAVDFTGSTDPRAAIIENRVILSRYLMATQMAGDTPPQETGLTCSTWYGKHHSEMIWWHTSNLALWRNDALLEKNLSWFQTHLPEARALANSRGLKGARWVKMTGPEFRESPGGNPLIIWNQPHMIYLCELLYRNSKSPETLTRYRDLVLETAECLASMVSFDSEKNTYNLGPPLWIAQEIYDPATSQNPSYELAYWRWALETAQKWRERLGQKREEKWDEIITHLAPLPQKDGLYVALGSNPDTFDNIESRHDHPTMLAPLGILPGVGVDRETMSRTLDAVLKTWDWETKIWGWDYPMIAMTATRLGRPETAVEVLLRKGPNNIYLPSGHCPQRSDEAMSKNPAPGSRKREIATYLPANGAFLSAVALMVAGWDGCDQPFPGFPKDGKWVIRAEGLHSLP